MINDDELQNQLILIAHHVKDCLEGAKEGDKTYVKKSLLDIGEIISELAAKLPDDLRDDIPTDKDIEQVAAGLEE